MAAMTNQRRAILALSLMLLHLGLPRCAHAYAPIFPAAARQKRGPCAANARWPVPAHIPQAGGRHRTPLQRNIGGSTRPQIGALSAMSETGSGRIPSQAVDLELQNAIQLNDLLMIQDMVQVGSVDVGLALARVAQLGGSGEMLRLLLQLGAKPDATDEFGRTAMLLAVSRRDMQMTEALLNAGANVEGIGGTYNGRTALMQAACSGATEMVSLLLDKGADPFATDRYGRNVIQQAAVMRREDVVRLIERHLRDKDNRTANPNRSDRPGLFGFFNRGSRSASGSTTLPAQMDVEIQQQNEMEKQLWDSIFSESVAVPGRPEVFKWRGRVLLQPRMDDQGLCIILEESTKDIVYRGAPPAPPTGASPSTPTPASAPESKRPPLPSFLQGNSEEQQQGALPSRGSFALEEPGAQASKDVVGVDDETERKLWQSILRDSSPVPGRNDVFEWRGKILRHPVMGEDGLVVIVDDRSGQVVFKGSPPPPDAAGAKDGRAGRSMGDGYQRGTMSVVKGTARVLASPAVALARFSAAAVNKVSNKDTGSSATVRPRLSRTMQAMTAALESVSAGSSATARAQPRMEEGDFGESSQGQNDAEAGSGRGKGVVWKELDEHAAHVRELSDQMRKRSPGQFVTTYRAKGHSHCPRDFSYKDTTLQLDIGHMEAVIGFREVENGAEMLVEPRVTMEQLVRAAAVYGMRPLVVPEFRRITVGGSIAGIAGESSSFKHGFFHDACTSYEVVLGDGSVVTATAKNEYADLFYAIPGSYGSLGVVTAASVRLVPAQRYVAMAYTHFDRVQDLMSYMADAEERTGVDFIEGIGYSPSSFVACEGVEVSAASVEAGVYGNIRRYDRFYSPWFYRNVQKKRGDMVRNPASVRDVIPLEDYFFRHDRGSFWMASYKMPSAVGRALGFLLPSHRMYKMANALPSVFDKSEILLQDFMIPFPNVPEFVSRLNNYLGVWPLWFCPLKNYGAPGPIFGVPLGKGDPNYCNVGAYGIPRRKVFDFEEDNKQMEMEMLQLGGRKVHYSHAYYPQEAFYSVIYDGDKYALIRDKYMADDAFPHVYDKIITKSGKL